MANIEVSLKIISKNQLKNIVKIKGFNKKPFFMPLKIKKLKNQFFKDYKRMIKNIYKF